MIVTLVYYDPQDSYATRTRSLIAVTTDRDAALRFIMEREHKTEPEVQSLIANRYYGLYDEEVYE